MADPGRGFPDYDKTFAYYLVGNGEKVGKMIWAGTLEEIAEADERAGSRVAYVDEGFFAYEPENENRLAWRVRGRVRRRLWAKEYRRLATSRSAADKAHPDRG